MKSSAFLITVHPKPRIIEVVYPSHPTLESYERYEDEIRRTILELGGTFDCLVDQRALKVAPPEISERITQLNAWAKDHGMRRTARVVAASAVSELQARRITREAQLHDASQLFHSRDQAWEHLGKAAV